MKIISLDTMSRFQYIKTFSRRIRLLEVPAILGEQNLKHWLMVSHAEKNNLTL